MLLDLIEARGDHGKWFAAAKDAGFLEVALVCARDFTAKEPKFAAEIGVVALVRLLSGSGYDPEVSLVQDALGHLLDAASRSEHGIGRWSRCKRLSTVPVM